MKEEYQKPELVTNENVDGVIPAGLAGAVAAFTTGVIAGSQIKKMLSGRSGMRREYQLVEVGGNVWLYGIG